MRNTSHIFPKYELGVTFSDPLYIASKLEKYP